MKENEVIKFRADSSGWFKLTLSTICVLFFLRDNCNVSISQGMLLIIFSIGILFFRKYDFAALGVCIPLFCNGIQTMALIFIALIVYIFKYGVRKLRTCTLITILLMLIELTHIFYEPFEFLQFGRHCVSYIYMGLMLDNLSEAEKTDIAFIMKSYAIVYAFTVVDIFAQFINRYGSISSFVELGIRLGNANTNLEGTYNTLYNNANMLGLYSILAIAVCVALLLMNNTREYKRKIVIWIVIMILAIYSGLVTGSRTFLASFLALIVLTLWAIFEDRNIKSTTKIGLIALSIIFGFVAVNTIFAASIDNLILRFASTESTNERNTLFAFYNQYIWNNPSHWLNGIGLQSISEKTGAIGASHNGIQETIVCLGFLGFTLVVLLFITIFRNAKIARQLEPLTIKNVLIFFTYIIFIQFIQFVRLPEVYLLVILLAYGLAYNYNEYEDNGVI